MEPNQASDTPPQSKFNLWLITTIVLAIFLIAGGVVFAWQESVNNKVKNDLQGQINNLQNQVQQLTKTVPVDETAGWKTITNINGFSIRYPASITVFGQGIEVDETTTPIVTISENPENQAYQGLFFQIDIHDKNGTESENMSTEEIARANYEANMANKNSFAELIAPISLITLDSKPAYTYTIISTGYSGKGYGWTTPKRKLKVIESDNNVNHFVIVYTPDDSVFDQILSTFKFTK